MSDPSFGLGSLILAIFASSGFWALLTAIINRKFQSKDATSEQQKKISDMVLGLGHEKICDRGNAYLHRGWITQGEYDDIVRYLYNPYKSLGGNGTAELIMERLRTLPVKPKDPNYNHELDECRSFDPKDTFTLEV